ncbi:MFS general substrate transporter [Aspergillus ellipticus CBS 707.79]|uniref:MFS general substrate transporter n=1 Tax=Aspergillus ellipticus CBS 707.79 TaxID=1448320 RepID=A0A319CRQ6_9EURO|nr:MFS general substrate transporter [Aspergillus ellipticus CBS 707.79]
MTETLTTTSVGEKILLAGEHDEHKGPPTSGKQGDEEPEPDTPTTPENAPLPARKKTWRFWAVFPALCMTTFLAALDTSILSTALPTIALDIHAGDLYRWITNSYILSSTVVLPLFGQMANIFGRRWMMISSVVIFAVGSGMAGGADNISTIIAGRTVQGIGGGGINILVDTVICDLVPLRQRGKYVALMASVWAVGTTIGPVLGGVFAQYVSWRWVFYINLPLCGVSLLLVLFLPLTWAGTSYPWSSWHILVPLLLGIFGIALFYTYQTSRFCQEPSIPVRLFSSATAICALWISFIQNMLLYWAGYFLSVYFQAVRSLTSTESGIYALFVTAAIAPFGVITGILIAVTGKYRPFHFIGYTCVTAGCGLFSLLTATSPARDWAGFQVLFGVGSGMIFSSTLPPIQVTLPESDVATATATWAFMRSLGCIWGIAIPTSIFNTKVQGLLRQVSDAALRQELSNGGAYALTSEGIVRALSKSSPLLMEEVLDVYERSLRWVWWIAVPFGVLGLVLSLPIRRLVLSEELHTEFGLEDLGEGQGQGQSR